MITIRNRVSMMFVLVSLAAFSASPVDGATAPKPPPKQDYPVLREFFPWGAYSPTLDNEEWMQTHLKCTSPEATERLYRHYVLHDINYFGINLGVNVSQAQAVTRQYLELAKRYGGKLDMCLYIGPMIEPYTGKVAPGVRWPLDTVVKNWTDYIEPFKSEPHILAWRIIDEIGPHRPYEQEYIYTLKQKIYDVDKLHPVSFFEQGSPSPVTPHLELGMGECYVHYGVERKGRDMSRVEDHLKNGWPAFQNQTLRFCILWAASHGGYEPTPADVRGQVYAMLANGWNGIGFYVAGQRMAPWAGWEPGDPLGKNVRLAKGKDLSLCLGFDEVNPMLAEVSSLGAKIIPLGHLLLQGVWQPEPGFAITGDVARLDRSFDDPVTGQWRVEKQDVPAFRVGQWRHPGGEVLIVYNRDFDAPHRGTLDLHGKAPDQKVYDLYTLAEVPAGQDKLEGELGPGDGHFYLVATEAGFARQLAEISRRRFEHESNKFDIILRRAAGTKILDLAATEARLAEAKDLYSRKDYETAWQKFEQAREVFRTESSRVTAYREIEDALLKANDSLYRIDRWLADRLLLLMPEPVMQNGVKVQSPIGSDRPALDAILDRVRRVAADYYPLTRRFESGKQTNSAPFLGMAAELQKAEVALAAYRPDADKAHPQRVAYLELGGVDPTGAWPFLQLVMPRAERVRLTDAGVFEDEQGRPCKLGDFDVVWFNYSQPTGDAFLDKGQRIPAPKALMSEPVLDAFRQFLRSGKGILLSGLAPAYVVPLGLETAAPDNVEINETRVYNPGYYSISYHQDIGLKPLVEQRKHPLFKGLTGSEHFFRADTADAPVTRASWTYPNVPQRGNVLAGMTTTVLPPPDKQRLDLVEFDFEGKGRVLAVGLPKFHFRQDMKRNDALRLKNYQQLIALMHNAFGYLGATNHPAFTYAPLNGPFYHVDYAKLETNPDLKVEVSSTRSGATKLPLEGENVHPLAPFHAKTAPFHRWDAVKTPAWVEIDFGKTIEIGKIHIANHWVSHTTWTIQQFRIQTWDDAQKKFVDTNPTISFQTDDRQESFRGITFTFEPCELGDGFSLGVPPLVTRRLRIADLDGVECNNPANKGVSVSKISVYGRQVVEGK